EERREGWPRWRRWEVCRAAGAYHRHHANAVRTMAARPQGVVEQQRQERAAADRRGAEGREFLYSGGIQRLHGGEFQFTAHRKACRRDLRVWDAGGPNPVG